MPIILRNLHTECDLITTYTEGIIEVSFWLPWQLSYDSIEVCGCCLLSQETFISNVNSIWLKTKELLRLHSGCHGN